MPPYVPRTQTSIQVQNKISFLSGSQIEGAFLTCSTSETGQDATKNNVWFSERIREVFKFKMPLIWTNIIFIGLHFIAAVVMLLYSVLSRDMKLQTLLLVIFFGGIGGFGVTAGVHRHWCHKAYKAKLPLKIILMLCYSVAGQNTIFDWVRDHRVHHKFSETDADPHNANRGFFFSHVGWLMMKKHPEVLKKGKTVDMSDILDDPVVQFHHKYFVALKILFCFVLPTVIPVYGWGETWTNAIFSQPLFRYVLSLNFTWFVNSLAHMYGQKPYDKSISPSENKTVALLAMGEGWHNYHHAFPWDYKAAELGDYSLNVTTFWIDQFAKIGWAYDLKQPSRDLVRKVVEATGDGSHPEYGHAEIPKRADRVEKIEGKEL